jgi:hypothetical protein
MHEMGKHVPIIPVITKADTMTIREAQNYKQEVFGRLQNPNVPHVRGKINTFKFDKETLDRAGMADVGGSTPPFLVRTSPSPCLLLCSCQALGMLAGAVLQKARLCFLCLVSALHHSPHLARHPPSHRHTASIAAPHPLVPLLSCVPVQVIASNDINDEMNQLDVPVFWPERKYPWGTAQAFNPDHSDLFFLRWDQPIAQLLVKMHLWGGLFDWCGCVQLPCLTLAMQYSFLPEACSCPAGFACACWWQTWSVTGRGGTHVWLRPAPNLAMRRALLLKEALEDIAKDKRAR